MMIKLLRHAATQALLDKTQLYIAMLSNFRHSVTLIMLIIYHFSSFFLTYLISTLCEGKWPISMYYSHQ
jgi:hypothetical protein